MASREPTTAPLWRMAKLGGLAGKVGASLLGSRLKQLGRSPDEREQERAEALVKNASRVVETLGEMKGAAMKVGQMLSLHDGLLPAEVAEVLEPLQGQAPKVPFAAMQEAAHRELPNFDELFESLEPEALAAASIGQVHRGRMRDGREVVVKIQYPKIDDAVRADLTNLRRLLKSLFALVSEADFDPVWAEVKERLLEEIDYENEARQLRSMAELWSDRDGVVIPEVIEAATTRRVLTLSYEPGLSAEEAERRPQELKNRWGVQLFEFLMQGLMLDRLIHADPNLANFAFRDDGSLVVYDFGCLKRVPETLARGYARLALVAVDGDVRDVPEILLEMGVFDEAGGPLGRDLTDTYVELFSEIFRASPPYRFGENEELYDVLMKHGMETWSQQLDIRFPQDIIFVQRALSGHYGNLCRLDATGDWRSIADRLARRAVAG